METGMMQRSAAMQRCIDDCFMCMAMCMETMAMCAKKGIMTMEMMGLMDYCADMCEMAMRSMMRMSPMRGKCCDLCAEL